MFAPVVQLHSGPSAQQYVSAEHRSTVLWTWFTVANQRVSRFLDSNRSRLTKEAITWTSRRVPRFVRTTANDIVRRIVVGAHVVRRAYVSASTAASRLRVLREAWLVIGFHLAVREVARSPIDQRQYGKRDEEDRDDLYSTVPGHCCFQCVRRAEHLRDLYSDRIES